MAPIATRFEQMTSLLHRELSSSTSVPEAPPVAKGPSNADGFSPAAIIAIVAAIVVILVFVPLVAIIIRRYERKRCLEMHLDTISGRLGSSGSSVREDHSLKSILVTKEVQRSSLRMSGGMRRPEQAHMNERGWSRTEVRGGDGR
jgi:hypothetical protein